MPSSVDFPQPEGPTTETNSTRRTSSDTSSMAVNPPSRPRAKRLVVRSRRIVGWVSMTPCGMRKIQSGLLQCQWNSQALTFENPTRVRQRGDYLGVVSGTSGTPKH